MANQERQNDNLCLLRAFCMYKNWSERLEEGTSEHLNQYLDINPNAIAENFRSVPLEDLYLYWDIYWMLFYWIFCFILLEFFWMEFIGVFPEQFFRRFSSTANLLRYSIHICYVTDVNKVYMGLDCGSCDEFLRRSSNIQRQLPKCEELVRTSYPRSVYQFRETLFSKLKAFEIEVTENKFLTTSLSLILNRFV